MLIPDRKPEKKMRVKPVFYMRVPKGAGINFGRSADVQFFQEHPKLFLLLGLLIVTAFVLPAILYFFLVFLRMDYSDWMILGIAGSFVVGIGLCNIVAAWMKQYLGHIFVAVCLMLGICLICASLILI